MQRRFRETGPLAVQLQVGRAREGRAREGRARARAGRCARCQCAHLLLSACATWPTSRYVGAETRFSLYRDFIAAAYALPRALRGWARGRGPHF